VVEPCLEEAEAWLRWLRRSVLDPSAGLCCTNLSLTELNSKLEDAELDRDIDGDGRR
jgi:hypothetical protein